MENKFNSAEKNQSINMNKKGKNSQVYIGAFIIIAGIILLLRRIGLPIPYWLTNWEMILIGVGLFIGAKSGFKDLTWVIPVIIGLIFLGNDIFPGFRFSKVVWPLGIIAIGMVIVLKGSSAKKKSDFNLDYAPQKPADDFVSGFQRIDSPETPTVEATPTEDTSKNISPNDELECVAVFGGVKRVVVSKNFRGGEIVAVLGGADIDLTHADFKGTIKLEATNILGGTKLIVPPTWDVQSEMVAIFGGVEDKRRIQPELIDRNKRLVLYGTALFGGLEVKSY